MENIKRWAAIDVSRRIGGLERLINRWLRHGNVSRRIGGLENSPIIIGTIKYCFPPYRRLRKDKKFHKALHEGFPPYRRLRNLRSSGCTSAMRFPPYRRLRKKALETVRRFLEFPAV